MILRSEIVTYLDIYRELSKRNIKIISLGKEFIEFDDADNERCHHEINKGIAILFNLLNREMKP